MIPTDDLVRVVGIVCWVVVIGRGLRARTLNELWWACVLLAVVTTLAITSNAQWIADVTGVGALATLLSDVAAVGAAALVVRSQARSSGPTERAPVPATCSSRRSGARCWASWAPGLSAPHTADAAATHPTVALHWLLLHLFC